MTTPLNPEWLQEQLDRADRLVDRLLRPSVLLSIIAGAEGPEALGHLTALAGAIRVGRAVAAAGLFDDQDETNIELVRQLKLMLVGVDALEARLDGMQA